MNWLASNVVNIYDELYTKTQIELHLRIADRYNFPKMISEIQILVPGDRANTVYTVFD